MTVHPAGRPFDRTGGMSDVEIVCYGLREAPPPVRGLVRDLRVRWALEESGRRYRQMLVGEGPGDISPDAYRELQPFGQVPAIVEGDLSLFESGAIVLHLAESSETLLPADAKARLRTIQWMFSALNTVEPPLLELSVLDLFYADEVWAKARRSAVLDRVRARLAVLGASLGGRGHLVGDGFTAADLLMISVLRVLRHTDLVTSDRTLGPYLRSGEARPAFQRALEAQMAAFTPMAS